MAVFVVMDERGDGSGWNTTNVAGLPKPAMRTSGVSSSKRLGVQHKPWIGGWLAKRQQGRDEETKAIAWKAQWRLCTRYKSWPREERNKPQIVTAIGRELLGFIWAIAVKIEAQSQRQAA
jgi:hypothetical protein